MTLHLIINFETRAITKLITRSFSNIQPNDKVIKINHLPVIEYARKGRRFFIFFNYDDDAVVSIPEMKILLLISYAYGRQRYLNFNLSIYYASAAMKMNIFMDFINNGQ